MVLLLIVKKAIEKTGVQARTLRRDKLDAFVQTRAHTCTLHAHCTLYGVLVLQYHFNFLHGEDLSSFSRLFQQGTHDFKGQKSWLAARGAGLLICKYVQAHIATARSFASRPTDSHRGRGSGRGVVHGRKRCQLHATVSSWCMAWHCSHSCRHTDPCMHAL